MYNDSLCGAQSGMGGECHKVVILRTSWFPLVEFVFATAANAPQEVPRCSRQPIVQSHFRPTDMRRDQ